MKFIVRYKCQSCGEVIEDKLTIYNRWFYF